ncbi:hypothetical protein IRJ41_016848, partial [Triplophysa rosa]
QAQLFPELLLHSFLDTIMTYISGSVLINKRIWMKTELESMGLWPGSPPVSNPMKTVTVAFTSSA